MIDESPSVPPMVVDPSDSGLLRASPSQNNLRNVLLTLVASVFEYLVVRLFVAVDLKRHPPRPGKDLRIFERCFIFDAIRADQRPAFHHVQCIAVEASMRVDPRSVVEVRDINDQRVAFPASP